MQIRSVQQFIILGVSREKMRFGPRIIWVHQPDVAELCGAAEVESLSFASSII